MLETERLNYRPKWMDRVAAHSTELRAEPTAGLPPLQTPMLQLVLATKDPFSVLPARLVAVLLDATQDIVGLVGKAVMESALSKHWSGIKFHLPPTPKHYFPWCITSQSFDGQTLTVEGVLPDAPVDLGEVKKIDVLGVKILTRLFEVLVAVQDSATPTNACSMELCLAIELLGEVVLSKLADQIVFREIGSHNGDSTAKTVVLSREFFDRLKASRRRLASTDTDGYPSIDGIVTSIDLVRGTFALGQSDSYIVHGTFSEMLQPMMAHALNRKVRVLGNVEVATPKGPPVHVRALDLVFLDAAYPLNGSVVPDMWNTG